MEQHFILCGLGRVGARVLEFLRTAGLPVVVIDTRAVPDDPRLAGAALVAGDCRKREVLEQAGLARARGVLVLTSDDLVSISTALTVRSLNPSVRVVVRMFNQNLMARMGKAVPNVFALSLSALVAPLLALIAQTGEALGTYCLEDGQRRQVAEVRVDGDSPLKGQPIAHAIASPGSHVLAYFPAGGKGCFLQDVNPEVRLGSGDRLVLSGDPHVLAGLLAPQEEDSLPHVLWAGFVRRHARMLWRTLKEMDLAVKICTGVLLSVVVVSTLVFYYGVERYSVANGLYRTISLIATGADMDRARELTHDWQRVYASFLRLFGAALIAAFTAIVTNYLLRARLGGALEIRRIPDSGHIIVCGLGNYGFRVVEELLRRGERVVVVERSQDSRFIATARRLGVAVIVGDATVPEVLRQAHAASARAVVAATTHELANLEIALLARELHPGQRVVLRLADIELAKTLREAADIRLALSLPDLAAPAFVAALFGDRVLSVFLVEGKLLAAVDLTVPPGDQHLDGQAVLALAIDYGFMPVGLVRADRQAEPNPAGARLQAGDRLTAIISLARLHRLLQREAVPRDWAVDVTGFPLAARPWLAQLVRTGQGLGAEDAERALGRLPLCLGTGLTRGQAEDLACRLGREKIAYQLRKVESTSWPGRPGPPTDGETHTG
jgi:Trk K+ transport system NAD-binding subunit